MCDPTQENGGWCGGAVRYTDLAYTPIDTYGIDELDRSAFAASHTNLGIGNRGIAALFGFSGSTSTLDTLVVPQLPQDDRVERTFFRALLRLGGEHNWTDYGDAWTRAAASTWAQGGDAVQADAVQGLYWALLDC